MTRISSVLIVTLAVSNPLPAAAAGGEAEVVSTLQAYESAWSRHDADAIASGINVRYRADGTELERVAVTYGLYKTGQDWKIFLSTTHSPDTVLRFR